MTSDERKTRIDIAHSIRLLALELNRLAAEIERPIREAPFEVVADVSPRNNNRLKQSRKSEWVSEDIL